MSVSTEHAIARFIAAQTAYVSATHVAIGAENNRVAAFTESAVSASLARSARVTLQKLADANKLATADLADTAPKGTLYVSLASVTVHAFTGDVLRKPETVAAEGETVETVHPIALQAVISKAYKAKGIGAKAIAAAIKGAKTQQDALAALKALEAVTDEAVTDEAVTGEDDDAEGSVTESAAQTLETLLSRALKMVADGAEVTDGARGMIAELANVLDAAAIAA